MSDSAYIHRSRTLRLKGFDYSLPGYYYLTICTMFRNDVFGTLVNNSMHLNDLGEIARTCWRDIPLHFSFVELDEYIIMPDHIHGILIITDSKTVGRRHAFALPRKEKLYRLGKPPSQSIPSIIGSFKSSVTRLINKSFPGKYRRLWQKNYFEHIIRDDRELDDIRGYIVTNPVFWKENYFSTR